MEQVSQQLTDIVAKLKSELSLQTDEEFYRSALEESRDIYEYLQKEYQKGLDEIELTEIDLDLLDFIKVQLPHSFWALNNLREDLYVNNSLVSLQKYSYKDVDDFVKALCSDWWDNEKDRMPLYESNEAGNEYNDNEGENDYDIDSVIRTIETLQKGTFLEDKEMILEDLFLNQSRQNKIKIIRHVLSSNKTEYTPWWNYILTNVWWDDELKPDLEKWWSSKDAARVVVSRFPYDYVLEHQFELCQHDYYSVCGLLAREKGFVIDKSRLNRFEYFQVLASNQIHIDDEEADGLLFDYIMSWMHRVHERIGKDESLDWRNYGLIASHFIDGQDYQSMVSHWFNYKPSLYELPNTVKFALNLCFMGNTNTVAKLIVWNRFLRSNTQSYSEENEGSSIALEQVADGLDDTINKNWRRFIELAIETCPVDKVQIEDMFLPQ